MPKEVEELVRRFPEMVKLPEEEVRVEAEGKAASAVVVRSLDRRVAADMVAREFRVRACLKGEVAVYSLERGYLPFRFKEAGERDLILSPSWVVAGQALAVEAWRPGFFLVDGAINSALVWVRLPQLPAEYWWEGTIRSLLSLAGDLVAVDDCTAERQRLGFARACLKIDVSRSLRPGTLIVRSEGPFWQRFVYKNLDGVCFWCGRFHLKAACLVGEGEGGPSASLRSENILRDGGVEADAEEGGQHLGPWWPSTSGSLR